MHRINVAVDGPNGVGKSSICTRIADHYGMIHLDTGAMYRCVALSIKRQDIALDDLKAIEKLCDTIDIEFDNGKVLLNKEDVTKAIKIFPILLPKLRHCRSFAKKWWPFSRRSPKERISL